MTMHAENLSTRDGGAAETSATTKKSEEVGHSSRFVVDGHSLIAVADPSRGDEETVPMLDVEQRALIVGRITCSGRHYLVFDADHVPAAGFAIAASAAEILTRRELQVALLIADGKCDKEIARQLGISGYTVREHIRRIFAKLNIQRRSAIVSCVLGQWSRS
jgi:DNA-binding CsgD family transcriptional regulator